MDEPVQPLALSYDVGVGDTAASLAEKTTTGSLFGEVCPHNRNLVTHVTSLCSNVCAASIRARMLLLIGPGRTGLVRSHACTVFVPLGIQRRDFISV